ncbi:hypothetical protein ACJ41O_003638 [Fusarium nematophilum]
MVSQKFVVAIAAFSFLVGSGASPCRLSSSLTSAATTTSLALIETSSTATGATSTTDLASSSDATSTTGAASSTDATSSVETSSTGLPSTTETASTTDASTTAYISTTTDTTTFVTSTTTVAEPVVTLLVNGDFDTNPASYDPWTIYSGAGFPNLGGSIGTDDTKAQAGQRSLTMRSASGSDVYVVQALDKTLLEADKEYKLSLWGQVSSSSGCSNGIDIWIDANNLVQEVGPTVHASGSDLAGD